jgi:hypothetical protein
MVKYKEREILDKYYIIMKVIGRCTLELDQAESSMIRLWGYPLQGIEKKMLEILEKVDNTLTIVIHDLESQREEIKMLLQQLKELLR